MFVKDTISKKIEQREGEDRVKIQQKKFTN